MTRDYDQTYTIVYLFLHYIFGQITYIRNPFKTENLQNMLVSAVTDTVVVENTNHFRPKGFDSLPCKGRYGSGRYERL